MTRIDKSSLINNSEIELVQKWTVKRAENMGTEMDGPEVLNPCRAISETFPKKGVHLTP